ncbi:hypothetical protein BV20DRAFT_1061451 [Pilatotrama ljubarskyi]|nr:hypothetical protein BV20DRAFT_1061451 [Pilatotrama ljubarskyi]
MPSVALNVEIISSIISFAYWGENRHDVPLDLQTVHALALTCRAFLEPALDQLWRRQLTLFNLVKTLPKDSWEVFESEDDGPDGQKQVHIKYTRLNIPKDWARFDYYAAKIRELGYDPRAPYGVDEWPSSRKVAVPQEFYQYLCILRAPYELLPNLRRVRWTTYEGELALRQHVYIFLNDPLVGLTLDFHDSLLDPSPSYSDATFIRYTLKAVIEQCPAFRDLELLWALFEGYADVLSEFIHSMPKLRTFYTNVRGMKEMDLVELASMPELRRTRLYVDGKEFPWLTRAFSQPPFPSIVDLTLEAPSLDNCTAFLIALEMCKLETLIVICEERPSGQMLRDFGSALVASCSHETLRVLSISDSGTSSESAPSSADGTVNVENLALLTSFPNIRALTLDLSGPYALDDAFPEKLLSTWPVLEKLSLGMKHGWGQRPALTFAGLAHIVKLCPRLEELSIAIDASHPVDASIVAAVTPNMRVRSINLGDSYVVQDEGGAVSLSRNLAALFPELEHISAKTPGSKAGEGDGAQEGDVPMEAPDQSETHDQSEKGLATEGFWREVEKQVATFALLRDMDFLMDLS